MDSLLNKNHQELSELLSKKRHELMEFRFLVRQGQVKNNKKGRELKKDIARVLTLLNKHYAG